MRRQVAAYFCRRGESAEAGGLQFSSTGVFTSFPVKFLHAIHDFLPRHVAGSEIYAFELCRELSTRHHVTVLTAEYDPASPHGHVSWRTVDGVAVVEIVNNWRCESFADTYQSPLMSGRIASVLDAVQPDIVHIHNLLNLSFDLPALAHGRGIPVAATLHDYTLVCPSGGQRIHRAEHHLCEVIDVDRCARCFTASPFASQMAFAAVSATAPAPRVVQRLARALQRRLPRLAGRAAAVAQRVASPSVTPKNIADRLARARAICDQIDLFVAPSQFLATEFQKLGVDPVRIRVSDNGFVPLQPAPVIATAGPLRIGFVGTLVWHKGVHVLLEAVRALRAGTYEVKLFGDPHVSPDYIADLRARSTGLPVRFMGGFDRERVADVYAGIDVLVVPSLWFENSPLVIHEAFMAGVPVVGARIGGIPELVRDGENGLLYDATSSGALAAALQMIIDHPDRLNDLRRGVPAVKAIAEDARDWEDRYAELLQRRTVGNLG